MDRNGKKAKAPRDDSNPERSDTKSNTRDALGRADASPGGGGGKRPGSAPGAPPSPGRKGNRG